VLAGLWLWGLVVFIRRPAPFELELPRRRPPPAVSHNLARWDLGPTLRASSYYGDWIDHHHPVFAVDNQASPDLTEKWASARSDEHPWIEVLWRESHTLERVVLRHAGNVEAGHLTARNYRITCLRPGGGGPEINVQSNTETLASHELPCDNARGVRIELERNGTEIVRLFEVETWGR